MCLAERQGKISDREWIWRIYCQLLRAPIEQQWGWDEKSQHDNFSKNLLATDFIVVSKQGNDIAAYLLRDRDDHFWLEMILVEVKYQRSRIGSELLKKMQSKAADAGKPLMLSVMNSNPVQGFYEKLGFVSYEQGADFRKMRWAP